MRLLFQISVLLLILQRGTSTDSCLPEDHRTIRLTGPRSIKNEGAVQLCVRTRNNEYIWHYIQTQPGWTSNLRAANLACRELGLSYTSKLKTQDRGIGVRANTVRLTRNADTVTKIINCNDGDEDLRDCLPDVLDNIRGRSQVAELICNCVEGSLRLVDGSSYNEGRVEVCLNGRWGTVCGDGWTEREAALVCNRLGYSEINARLQTFVQGSGPQYTCTVDDNFADCTILPTLRSCNHTGINCLSNQELGNGSTSTLGAITGVLVVALVAVVTAWIISCVYTKRSRSHAPKPPTNPTAPILTNPVYGVGPGTQEVTNNTSVGPTYEQIDEAGNRYDVIRNRADPVTNGEHTYNVLHHTGRSGNSHVTTKPQDYEVPMSNN